MQEPHARNSGSSRYGELLAAAAGVSFAALALGFALWQHQWAGSLELLAARGPGAAEAARLLGRLSLVLACLLAVLGAALLLLWLQARAGAAARSAADSHYRALVEQSSSGVLLVEPSTLRLLDANPALLRSVGLSLEKLRTLSLGELLCDEHGASEPLVQKLRDPDPRLTLHVRIRAPGGELVDAEVSGNRLATGTRELLALSVHDVTMRRKIEAQLLDKQQRLDHLAHHDQLTGLPNRHHLAAHLPAALAQVREAGLMLAVLFLDLDRFKHINDSRGHETGDKLLQTVAQRIRSTVRTEDIVVRMGGDEFIVVLRSIRSATQVNETAARINEALSAPVIIDGRPLVTTVSIGVSLFPRDGADMGELLKHSDTAMYQAKDRGRNNFQLFSPVMDRKLKERIAIETALRAALRLQQLDVHYQPIIDIGSRRVVALEALLRWRHPTQGFLPPGRFIAVAEETGLIVRIGEFVLERVAVDAARWRRAGGQLVPIAVNISAVQLQRSKLREAILRVAQQHGLKPQLLQLELTESALFERREARIAETGEDAISQLRDLGVRIAIDDFGTGYSSLSYLKRWRVDYLKIDRGFVRDLVTDMSDLAIVGAIIAIARHLNIAVVAEGIEGFQQLEKLRQLGCGLAQGYLFARPTPAAECGRFLLGEPLSFTDEESPLESFVATGTGS